MSLMQKKFVEKYKWINKDEMLDIVAISQSSPGAIAINASIMVGYRIAGFWGALCTLLGAILPPLVIISAITFFYTVFSQNLYVGYFLKGMQAGIAAVIVDVIYKMAAGFVKKKDILSMALMAAAFCLSYFLEINVILIIAGAIALGTAYHFCAKAVKAKKQKRQAERTDSNGAQDLPIDKKMKRIYRDYPIRRTRDDISEFIVGIYSNRIVYNWGRICRPAAD